MKTFNALPWQARFLVILVVVTVGFFVYYLVSGGASRDHAVSACQDAVKTKIGGPVAFGDTHVSDAANGRYDVTGKVGAVTYDCLVDGDGSNPDVELLP